MRVESRFRMQVHAFRGWYAQIMRARGFNDYEAEATADWATLTARYGVETHGARKLQHLLDDELKRSGTCVRRAAHEVLSALPSVEVWDGHYQLGPVVATRAQHRAAEMAKRSGFGLVVVRRTGHYGWGPAYALKTLDDDLLTGNFCQGAIPIVVPVGGESPTLGSNAVCLAMRTFNEARPLFLWDTGIAATSWGTVQSARLTGNLLPAGCAVDSRGQPTSNPHDVASLLPAGSIGNALGLGIELFAALAGASAPTIRGALVNEVPPGECPGCVFMHFALNLTPFDAVHADHGRNRCENVANMVDAILGGNGTARLPGERKLQEFELSKRHGGLLFQPASMQAFQELANRFRVELPSRIDEIEVTDLPAVQIAKK